MNKTSSSEQTSVYIHQPVGKHLLLTLSGCDPVVINDVNALIDLAREAVLATGATIMQISSQRFEPQGATIFAVLAESHASLHTYPEAHTIFWDCFTCGTSCDPEKSIEVLVDALRPKTVDKEVIERGTFNNTHEPRSK